MSGRVTILKGLDHLSRIAAAMPSRLSASVRYRLEQAEQWRVAEVAAQHNHRLDGAMRQKCRDYSIATFGTDSHAAFLALCVGVHGAWRDGLIPETYFFRVVGPARYGAWYDLSRAKTLTPMLFRGPFIPDIATVFSGQLYRPDLTPVPRAEVKAHLFDGRSRVIFKSDAGGRGLGIRFFTAEDFDPAELAAVGNGVFQSIIEPHPDLAIPGVSALTTIRIGTLVGADGVIRPSYVTLRLGRAAKSHVTSYDSVRLDVDPVSGEWADTGYLKDWTPLKDHPDAPVRFSGRAVPEMGAAIELCRSLHAQTPFLPSIGWDLCLNRQGQYELMEWNIPHGISFAEPVNGPIFAGLGFEQLWKQEAAE